jgi:hypothetical protein
MSTLISAVPLVHIHKQPVHPLGLARSLLVVCVLCVVPFQTIHEDVQNRELVGNREGGMVSAAQLDWKVINQWKIYMCLSITCGSASV